MEKSSDVLQFSFQQIAEALAATIRDRSREGAFVVGITGPWGSGKTTLMNAVSANLVATHHIPLYFNAWAHSRRDEIWRGLFVAITAALRKRVLARPESEQKELLRELDDAERSLYTAFSRSEPGQIELDGAKLAKAGVKVALKFVPWGDLAGSVINAVTRMASVTAEASQKKEAGDSGGVDSKDFEELFDVFRRHTTKSEFQHVQSLEQFKASLERIVHRMLAKDELLVVSIDDVDRCLPEQQLDVFEAIKLFLDLPGSVFLVAMDQDVIQHALDIRYGQNDTSERRISAEIYAEKMPDLNFMIPPPDIREFKRYISACLPMSSEIINSYALLECGLPVTPRTWRRFAERADFYRRLMIHDGETISPGQYASFLKIQLLGFRWPSFMRTVGGMEGLIIAERCVTTANISTDSFAESVREKGSPLSALRERSTEVTRVPASAIPYLNDVRLLRVLASDPRLDETPAGEHSLLERLFNVTVC